MLSILPAEMGLKEPWIVGCGELGSTDFYILTKTLWNKKKILQTNQEGRARDGSWSGISSTSHLPQALRSGAASGSLERCREHRPEPLGGRWTLGLVPLCRRESQWLTKCQEDPICPCSSISYPAVALMSLAEAFSRKISVSPEHGDWKTPKSTSTFWSMQPGERHCRLQKCDSTHDFRKSLSSNDVSINQATLQPPIWHWGQAKPWLRIPRGQPLPFRLLVTNAMGGSITVSNHSGLWLQQPAD